MVLPLSDVPDSTVLDVFLCRNVLLQKTITTLDFLKSHKLYKVSLSEQGSLSFPTIQTRNLATVFQFLRQLLFFIVNLVTMRYESLTNKNIFCFFISFIQEFKEQMKSSRYGIILRRERFLNGVC